MRRFGTILAAFLLLGILSGCAMLNEEQVKLEDLDFTILSQEKIPEELMTIIREKGTEPFRLTYSDKEYLYISIGYGQQPAGGYSIVVNELYLAEDAIYVSTSLLGPEAGAEAGSNPTSPCIVIKTEYREETVMFE